VVVIGLVTLLGMCEIESSRNAHKQVTKLREIKQPTNSTEAVYTKFQCSFLAGDFSPKSLHALS
jgi:hypothetical protein